MSMDQLPGPIFQTKDRRHSQAAQLPGQCLAIARGYARYRRCKQVQKLQREKYSHTDAVDDILTPAGGPFVSLLNLLSPTTFVTAPAAEDCHVIPMCADILPRLYVTNPNRRTLPTRTSESPLESPSP